MGFIENLRQRLVAEAQTRQQREESLRLAKQVEDAARMQREARETEIHAQRRRQAEAFKQESGIGKMLSELFELMKHDPAIKPWPLRLYELSTLPEKHSGGGEGWPDTSEYQRSEDRTMGEIKSKITLNQDSIYDFVKWSTGVEERIKRHPKTVDIRNYINYFVVETSPEGDIVFHSRTRNSIALSLWRGDKNNLEEALGQAFNNPSSYFIEQTWNDDPSPRRQYTIG